MNRVTRTLLVVLVSAVALAIPAAAEALGIKWMKVTATSKVVKIALRYCDRPGRIHEHYSFYPANRPTAAYHDDVYVRLSKTGCATLSGSHANHYAAGLWVVKLTMSDSGGSTTTKLAHVHLP